MLKKTGIRGSIVGDTDSTAVANKERAESDGSFQERPMWKARQRPDTVWGPTLTLQARQFLIEERKTS